MTFYTATFAVNGTPVAQPRARATVRRRGAHVFAGCYDDGSADGWKATVRHAGRADRPATPITDPIAVELVFYMPRPRDHYRTGRFASLLRDSAPRQHAQRPDADNLAKAVLDALTDDGWWRDDGLVTSLSVAKLWCSPTERPGCTVSVHVMKEAVA